MVKYINDKIEVGSFEHAVLHCIGNNKKNDNFEFCVNARDDNDRLEVLNDVNETLAEFETEITKLIGKCRVLINLNELNITVKKEAK